MPYSLWRVSPQTEAAACLADVLRLVRGVISDALIDDHGWGRVLAQAERLPPSAADAMFGFECRLDHADASADLLLSIPRDAPFARDIVQSGTSMGLGADSITRFVSEMRQNSPVAATIDLVALEYDLAVSTNNRAPGFFLRSVAESGHVAAGALTEAIALAAGRSEKPAERNGVASVLAAMPPGATIRWAGAFPGRNQRTVRLLVRGLGGDSGAFVSRIGWNGDATAVDRLVASFRACGVDNHVVALDISDEQVSPWLGLEFSRPGRVGGGWGKALDMMVRERWCLPHKACAMRRAIRSERIFSSGGISELHCGIHHVKIALQRPEGGDNGTGDAIAKGYIACVLQPL